MADIPGASPPQLPIELSYLHQFPDEQEREDNVPFSVEDSQNPSSSSSGSQPTSSDKLSALPSHFQSSPPDRPGPVPRMKNSSTSGSELPSTSEPRLPSQAVLRATLPIAHSVSESAVDRETPSRQHVSFDSDRGSSTSPRPNPRQLPASSELILPSAHGSAFTSLFGRLHHDSSHKQGHGHSRKASHSRKESVDSQTPQSNSRTGSPVRSHSPSRAVSPLRTFLGRFSPLGRVYSREEPFIAIDPFQFHFSLFARCFGSVSGDIEATPGESRSDISCTCACVPLFGSARFHGVHIFAFDTLPRQLYLHTQLRLPSLYFSRVARIFEEAAVSRPEIQRITDACEGAGTETMTHRGIVLPFPEEWVPPNVSPALARFKRSWESFVDSLMREWKTLNVLSALLLTAIMTMFQAQDAENDPLTRTAALCSLISALMSLSYGIMYIVHFGNMRSMYRASRFAEEAQRTETAIFWNVWVLLALPGVWLAWSVLGFIVSIMSYVWRTGASNDAHKPLSPTAAYVPRIAITCQLALGLVYFGLVVRTFRSYGEAGRRARVVQRRGDVQIELETTTRTEREREGEREREYVVNEREDERGRSTRANDGAGRKRNELGLSGLDRKQQDATPADGAAELPMSDSFSSLGM